MKWINKVLDENSDVSLAFFWQLVGPLFILCTFALAPNNLLIFFTGVVGLFLSSKYRMGGFIASVVLLSIVGVVDHLFYSSSHLWELGIEGSYAIAFFITAQNADRHHSFVHSLFSQLQTRSSSIIKLEEEFTKSRVEATKQQVFAQEKIESLQKQLEDMLSEQSSLLVLNEVLRKTTAKHIESKNALNEELYQLQSRIVAELSAKEELQAKLAENGLLAQNQQLKEEIALVRIDRDQLRNINESLTKSITQEQQRAQLAYAQINGFEREKQELDATISALEKELKPLRDTLKQVEIERDRYRMSSENADAIQRERNHLKDRLQQAEFELAQKAEALAIPSIELAQKTRAIAALELELSQKTSVIAALESDLAQKADTVAAPKLQVLEEKIKSLTYVELLYKQLRAQFEEKNAVLHKTRSELFTVDTALQTLQKEMAGKELEGIPKDFVEELACLENELTVLQEENKELQNIISTLHGHSEPIVKKKSE